MSSARARPLGSAPPKLEGVANGSKSAVWADLRGVLAGRDFRRLFATRLVSQAGDGIVTAGVGTYVFFNATTFPSPAAGAAAFAVLYLPYSLIGPFAGVFIASDPQWAARFTEAGVPIIGDDIKSQVGATITHRVLAKLFEDRGVELLRTYQLNFGGNMDFMNMLERKRLQSKKISKTQSVTSQIPHEMAKADVHIGPSDHVPWLDDRKLAFVRLEGKSFGDVPLNLEYKLEVWDSPNSAGVIIDAVRAAKIAKDRGIGGPVIPASAYLMKSPPEQMPDDVARTKLEEFIEG